MIVRRGTELKISNTSWKNKNRRISKNQQKNKIRIKKTIVFWDVCTFEGETEKKNWDFRSLFFWEWTNWSFFIKIMNLDETSPDFAIIIFIFWDVPYFWKKNLFTGSWYKNSRGRLRKKIYLEVFRTLFFFFLRNVRHLNRNEIWVARKESRKQTAFVSNCIFVSK